MMMMASKNLLVLFAVFSLAASAIIPAFGKVLQGSVQQDLEMHRLARPDAGSGPLNGGVRSNRIQRPLTDNSAPLSGLVDTAAFAPLQGRAGTNGPLHSGVVQAGDFAAPPKN